MFLDLLRRRRSIRRYQKKPLAEEQVAALMEAALRSFSSRSLNPWQFVVVSDSQLLSDLADCKPHGAAFLKDAVLGVVVCADPTRSDVWVEDASIATAILHLTAASLGLGSCWVQIRKRMHADGREAQQAVRQTLGIPDHLAVESILAVGEPAEVKKPHAAESLDYTKVHANHYGVDWQQVR